MSPAEAMAAWFEQVRSVAISDETGPIFGGERWRQMAGALRRMEASEELEPLVRLLAAQCDLVAIVDQNLENLAEGG